MIFVLVNFPSYQRYRTEGALDILQAMLAMPRLTSVSKPELSGKETLRL